MVKISLIRNSNKFELSLVRIPSSNPSVVSGVGSSSAAGVGVGVEADESRARRLRREVRTLAAREARVTRAVQLAETALSCLSSEHGALAYITYADLRSIRDFRNQTVIPIKAPPDTRLSVSTIECYGASLLTWGLRNATAVRSLRPWLV